MTSACACSTIFFGHYRVDPEAIIAQYEETVEPANGYLTRLNHECVLVDATASELADWSRQIDLAAALTSEDVFALSVFLVGDLWALGVARNGKTGPVAAFTPDSPKTLEQIPHKLLAIEQQLIELFPDADGEEIDRVLGMLLDGMTSPDDAFSELLDLLGCPADWLRWSWYETIPEQLFLDPDLAHRVTPLGAARALWEE